MNLKLDNNNDGSGTVFRGKIIYIQDAPSKYLYILKRGEVHLLKMHNNKFHFFQKCVAGDILNEVSVLTNKKTEYCAFAKTDVEVVKIEAKEVRNVIEKCPKWIPDLFKTLCERLVDSQEIILEHNLKSGQIDQNVILTKNEEQELLQQVTNWGNA